MSATKPVIYLHIGAMKTGTTYLQMLLRSNQERLLEAGYLYPARPRDQGHAVREVLAMKRTMRDPAMRERVAGKWNRLVTEMLGHPGEASIMSMEFLSFADEAQARRIVESFGGAEVHVILGVRDAVRVLPAQWQTQAHNASTLSWPEFATGAAHKGRLQSRRHKRAARTFRTAQDIGHILRVWRTVVPPERIHVLVVPPSGSDELLLWRRFASILGVDPDIATQPTGRANSSIGQASADLLRRVNAVLGPVPFSEYDTTVKWPLAKKVLARRAGLEARAAMDRATLKFAVAWNAQVRSAVLDSGVQVVGELAELPTEVAADLARSAPPALADPPDDEVVAAAAAARDGLVELIHERARRLQSLHREPSRVDLDALATEVPTDPGRWAASARPVEAAVEEVASLVRIAIDLRGQILAAQPGS